ncbi:ribosome biogenesis GTPase Der [Candidatus Nomurabacteria bacterium]|jgi:GTP-binding protein|nr:ribosome biogenesis GTPase Der [Candidatus Saccharibacteria bacterium]MCB9839626.1 ribosome biogenesis GTPase Der [Candidatus Nomurabacteria bacterium]
MSKNKVPIVAIVGRANVGKSSLFNAILGYREAIVAREAGTTRDSIMAKANYASKDFWLVDTAGMKDAEDEFEFTIQEQIAQATDSADIIMVVVEADIPVNEEDRRIAKMALKSKKQVFLIVNKSDKNRQLNIDDYRKLGIKQIHATSTTQNKGIEQFLDELADNLPQVTIKTDPNRIKVAILGRPNVGKSQLFNALSKKQQAIVADRAGTTRDINRNMVKFNKQEIELLDTAGIRRSGKIEVGIEKFSVIRSLSAIEEADICLLLMDVNELGTQLDQKIAGLVKEAGKGLILVVSKWDIVKDKDAYTRDLLAPQIQQEFIFVPWAPLIFTSSITGQNVTKIFELVSEIHHNRQQKISTSVLNRWLRAVVDEHPPAGLKNTHPRLNYITQTDEETPNFKVFGSQTKFLHWSYKRYLERRLREQFGFEGTPIKMWFIPKNVDRHTEKDKEV